MAAQFKPINILNKVKIQQYQWGSASKQSLVGQCAQQQCQHYAELWMGIHPKGPSYVRENLLLNQYLQINKQPELDFLFKLLSIEKCLSIQVHPNKQQAQELHKQNPKLYSDSNDKPEMALTLSETFQLFLGFIQSEQFQKLKTLQPFSTIISRFSKDSKDNSMTTLTLLEIIVKLQSEQIKELVQKLMMEQSLKQYPLQRQQILNRLNAQFPDDSGILVSCLLQYKKLPKYSCFGIDAGIPHSYIKGECAELMKNSDNVLRLGLTPKEKDIVNMIRVLNEQKAQNNCKVKVSKNQSNFKQFKWKQFKIYFLDLKNQRLQIEFSNHAVGICLNGCASIEKIESQSQKVREECPTFFSFYLSAGAFNFFGNCQLIISSSDC